MGVEMGGGGEGPEDGGEDVGEGDGGGREEETCEVEWELGDVGGGEG